MVDEKNNRLIIVFLNYNKKKVGVVCFFRSREARFGIPSDFPKNLSIFKVEIYKKSPIGSRVKHIEVVYMYDLKDCGEKGEFLVPAFCYKVYGDKYSHFTGPPGSQLGRDPYDPSKTMKYVFFWLDVVNIHPLFPYRQIAGSKALVPE